MRPSAHPRRSDSGPRALTTIPLHSIRERRSRRSRLGRSFDSWHRQTVAHDEINRYGQPALRHLGCSSSIGLPHSPELLTSGEFDSPTHHPRRKGREVGEGFDFGVIVFWICERCATFSSIPANGRASTASSTPRMEASPAFTLRPWLRRSRDRRSWR